MTVYKFVAYDTTIKKCEFLGKSRSNFTLRHDGKMFFKKPSYCFDSEVEAWEFLIERLNAALSFAQERLQTIINNKINNTNRQ